jgi:hypothetical protein
VSELKAYTLESIHEMEILVDSWIDFVESVLKTTNSQTYLSAANDHLEVLKKVQADLSCLKSVRSH